MLEKRAQEIGKMVDKYNEIHFPDADWDSPGLEDCSSGSEEVLQAVKEMGISLEEYKEWERHWKQIATQFNREEDLAENFDLIEEELRDEEASW